MKKLRWRSIQILLNLVIGLALFTQACQNRDASNQSTSLETDVLSTDKTDRDNKDRQLPPREESPQVITEQVVVIANPLDQIPAELTSQYSDSKINIRAQPTTQSKAQHFGYKGDRITLLQEAKTDSGYTWYFVQFDRSKAKGWVRDDFVRQISPDEGGDDVIPVDYSGDYVYKSPQTGVITAKLTFQQNRTAIQFKAIQQNPSCPSETQGEAFFVPESNRFVGGTNDEAFRLTFIPMFLNGQHTGKFRVETADGKTGERLTENFEACTYDGVYQRTQS